MEKLAILIAVEDYPFLGDVKTAENNAKAVADALKRFWNFKDDEIKLITSSGRGFNHASPRMIRHALNEFEVCEGGLDLLLVGFWGRGGLESCEKENFSSGKDVDTELFWYFSETELLPELFDSEKSTFSKSDQRRNFYELENTGLDLYSLFVELWYYVKKCVFFLDYCPTSLFNTDLETRLIDKYAREMCDLAFLCSCFSSEQPLTAADGKLDLFTSKLVEGIEHGAKNYNGSLDRLAGYVCSHVLAESKKRGMVQTPAFYYYGDGDVRFQTARPKPEEPKSERSNSEPSAPDRPKPNPIWKMPETKTAGRSVSYKLSGRKLVFHWAPAGTFVMGSPENEKRRDSEEGRHTVTLTKGFWILETPVTQTLWREIMGYNPSEFVGSSNPVENVSWNECQDFIARLNSRTPHIQDWKYALPTEAQWEYACRAGTETAFSFGLSCNGEEANCDARTPYQRFGKGKYVGTTTSVDRYKPNAWGLRDMHGNVFEWCADWYGPYSGENLVDPKGAKIGDLRVARGGSWCSAPDRCRAAFRFKYAPETRIRNLGLRLVLVPDDGR